MQFSKRQGDTTKRLSARNELIETIQYPARASKAKHTAVIGYSRRSEWLAVGA
jgi:hypothetical protein